MNTGDISKLEPIKTRSLCDGEWVDFSEVGIQGVQISGPRVRAVVHEDGPATACGIPAKVQEGIEAIVFATIVVYNEIRIGRRELHFLRMVAGLSSGEMAALLKMTKEELLEFEKRGESLSWEQSSDLRGRLLPHMIKLLSTKLDTERQNCIPLPPAPGGSIEVADGLRVRVDSRESQTEKVAGFGA